MTSASSTRAWAELFSRNGRRADESSPRSRSVATADVRAVSRVFPKFLAALAHGGSPVILDLGPVVGANIAFFGERFACKIHVEDLFADIECHARAGNRAGLAAFLRTRLRQAPDSIDGVLCWDVFDFLDRGAAQGLAASLARVLKPGGVLHGSFGTTSIDVDHYTRTTVESPGVLRQRALSATPFCRAVLVTRDIMKMFDGMEMAESVLLKSNTRETLFRKA